MQARRAFLDAGHYQPLRDAIAERLRHYAPTDLLDIGCGEGYYTHAFAAIASRSWGLDVSKPAIRAAAKRYPQVNFCVASSQRTTGTHHPRQLFGVAGRVNAHYRVEASVGKWQALAGGHAKIHLRVAFCRRADRRLRHVQPPALPFSDASFDAVVRIYAPCNAEELARVVRPGGWVITATPGPRHLLELKGLIYDEVRLHELKLQLMQANFIVNKPFQLQ